MRGISIGIFAFLASTVAAQSTQSKYGMCGGGSYAGPTVCASGTRCKCQNEWYYQCVGPDDTSGPETCTVSHGNKPTTPATSKPTSTTTTKPPTTTTKPPSTTSTTTKTSTTTTTTTIPGGGGGIIITRSAGHTVTVTVTGNPPWVTIPNWPGRRRA